METRYKVAGCVKVQKNKNIPIIKVVPAKTINLKINHKEETEIRIHSTLIIDLKEIIIMRIQKEIMGDSFTGSMMGRKIETIRMNLEIGIINIKVDKGTTKVDKGTTKVDRETTKVDKGTTKVDREIEDIKMGKETIKVDKGTTKMDKGIIKTDKGTIITG